MKKIKTRAMSLLLAILLLGGGTAVFAVQYLVSGGTWASSAVSRAVWNGGTVARGTVVDRDGVVLADIRDGVRVFAEDAEIRRAALHVVGDAQGNIGTGALSVFSSRLVGWNALTGLNALSESGGTVTLTVSARVQSAALKALGKRNGAVVILNYKTGDIVCAVSSPTFDPANAPDVASDASLVGVYLNRALSSTFTPGSAFKTVTAAAALGSLPDVAERTFHCDGSVEIGDGVVTCPSKHGDLTLYDAFAHSCNVTFALLADEIGASAIYDCAAELGLLSNLNIDGISTAAGRYMSDANAIDTAWSGVGQGGDLASPIALARLCAAVANGGLAPRMHILAATRITRYERIMSAETADTLREMMIYAVDSYYGSGNFPGLTLGAKSGTAEVGSGEPHAWFIGFSADPAAPYAFAVVVENGGSGRTVAGEVARVAMTAAVG